MANRSYRPFQMDAGVHYERALAYIWSGHLRLVEQETGFNVLPVGSDDDAIFGRGGSYEKKTTVMNVYYEMNAPVLDHRLAMWSKITSERLLETIAEEQV